MARFIRLMESFDGKPTHSSRLFPLSLISFAAYCSVALFSMFSRNLCPFLPRFVIRVCFPIAVAKLLPFTSPRKYFSLFLLKHTLFIALTPYYSL
jgi:hypothetical protein